MNDKARSRPGQQTSKRDQKYDSQHQDEDSTVMLH